MGIKRGTSGLGTLWKTDPEKARGIASKGGKTAHQKGTAYEWTVNEAREASQLGAIARAKNRAAKL
ncbi:MAG: KGG domain-containing protein, partial [Candidatus Paceibacterota bacterium]